MEEPDQRTLKQKLLFYTTAFFVLLGTFSLFAFLFLVPFVIEPAFKTIFMQFDERPAFCVTADTAEYKGAKNCSWTSCKEGCTRDIFECVQISVNYKIAKNESILPGDSSFLPATVASLVQSAYNPSSNRRVERGLMNEYPDYQEKIDSSHLDIDGGVVAGDYSEISEPMEGLMGNNSEWFFIGAKLFPNVKGCGYPPYLNCSVWNKKYKEVGTNFSCFYSRIDPSLVISDLDLFQNTLYLVLAMAVPIPSFIASVIYLTFAYFKIYNEDEEKEPLDKNAEDIADDALGEDGEVIGSGEDEDGTNLSVNKEGQLPNGTSLTPNSIETNSFGHQLKVKMADEMSRDSIEGGLISNSGSAHGYLFSYLLRSFLFFLTFSFIEFSLIVLLSNTIN